jgi:hypothetical protein
MPNRWIKEAYCASSRINAVSAEARDLWVRLLVNADDHGLFHGGAQLVASACFPLQPNARKCEQLLVELSTGGLVARYESGGKRYLALTQWYERPRSKPKYPLPPQGISEQLQATENNCEQLHVSTTTTTTTSNAPNDISFDAETGWAGITDRDREMWRSANPAVDVEREIAAAAVWVRANPKNRKANWRRFLSGWLSRSQERAPAKGGGPTLRQVVA